LYDTSW